MSEASRHRQGEIIISSGNFFVVEKKFKWKSNQLED